MEQVVSSDLSLVLAVHCVEPAVDASLKLLLGEVLVELLEVFDGLLAVEHESSEHVVGDVELSDGVLEHDQLWELEHRQVFDPVSSQIAGKWVDGDIFFSIVIAVFLLAGLLRLGFTKPHNTFLHTFSLDSRQLLVDLDVSLF